MNDDERFARNVACPRCCAAPGATCTTEVGYHVAYHVARYAAAEKLARRHDLH